MLIKAGVDISRLEREARRSLLLVESICMTFAVELVITSTYEGNHSAGSLHYCNNAYDIRTPKTNVDEFVKSLKSELSNHFDVILEKNHIHIEYDPK